MLPVQAVHKCLSVLCVQRVTPGQEACSGNIEWYVSVVYMFIVLPVQAIHDGVSVPSVHRKTPGWEAFLKEMGLVWGELPKPLKKKSSKATGVHGVQFCMVKAYEALCRSCCFYMAVLVNHSCCAVTAQLYRL